jgi:hypothetical protein
VKIAFEKHPSLLFLIMFEEGESFFYSFCHQEFTAGGQLGDEGHAVLVVVDLDQAGEPRVVEDVHHLELVHHPEEEFRQWKSTFLH